MPSGGKISRDIRPIRSQPPRHAASTSTSTVIGRRSEAATRFIGTPCAAPAAPRRGAPSSRTPGGERRAGSQSQAVQEASWQGGDHGRASPVLLPAFQRHFFVTPRDFFRAGTRAPPSPAASQPAPPAAGPAREAHARHRVPANPPPSAKRNKQAPPRPARASRPGPPTRGAPAAAPTAEIRNFPYRHPAPDFR